MTAASPARSDSPWSPPKQEVKKKDKKKDKDKKKKEEKNKEKDKKDKKDKKEKAKKQERPDTSSDGSPPADRSGRAEQPNMQPSGLLGGDDGGSRGRTSEPTNSRRLAERSRSRTELRPNHERMRTTQGLENLAQNVRDAAGDDKGKGKGKGKDGKDGKEGEEAQPKEEPNFEASGLLGMEDNSKNGVVMKFVKPVEARIPAAKWRLYCFSKQSGDNAKVMHVHRKEGYLFGKDRRIADVPTDHPTCSKQHAVLHYRLTPDGLAVKPYIMDLESINGTFVNGERIDSARYCELREGDKLKFGMSSREYVLLHAGSANGMAIDPKALESPE